jgi:hypothetical protein
MQASESATIKQWRQVLTGIRELITLDGRTKKAKRLKAQRQLLLVTASDVELEQMARISAEMFDYPYEDVLSDMKRNRELHRKNVKSWRGNLVKVGYERDSKRQD